MQRAFPDTHPSSSVSPLRRRAAARSSWTRRAGVSAAPAASPLHPVTVIAWAGPPNAREAVGLAADAAESIVELPMTDVVGGRSGLVWGEAAVAGRPLRVLNLELLGSD